MMDGSIGSLVGEERELKADRRQDSKQSVDATSDCSPSMPTPIGTRSNDRNDQVIREHRVTALQRHNPMQSKAGDTKRGRH